MKQNIEQALEKLGLAFCALTDGSCNSDNKQDAITLIHEAMLLLEGKTNE